MNRLEGESETPLDAVSPCGATRVVALTGSTTLRVRAPAFADSQVTLTGTSPGLGTTSRCFIVTLSPLGDAGVDSPP